MRSIFLPFLALTTSLTLAACGGDDGDDGISALPDAGMVDPDPDPQPSVCGPLRGSCRAVDGSGCFDVYAPAFDTTDYATECEADGDATWAAGACATAGTVGGCRLIEAGQLCADIWAFPPITTAQVQGACAAPNVFLPPR